MVECENETVCERRKRREDGTVTMQKTDDTKDRQQVERAKSVQRECRVTFHSDFRGGVPRT